MKEAIKLIWEDAEALSLAAAHYFILACNRAIEKDGIFSVALSGGSTPRRLYETLAMPAFSRNINWEKVLLFWGDERFVPHTHTDSNYKMVKDALLSKIKIPRKNIFAIPVNGEPADCAAQYEAVVKKNLGNKESISLTLLGMGDDGHTASLFPGTDILNESKKLVSKVWVEEKQNWRISFTYPLINRSKEIMFLIAGESKRPVLKKILSARTANRYPVQGVKSKSENMILMLDKAAMP